MHHDFIYDLTFRSLHSYNLIWAVCHLFPQQRGRTHTFSLGETIGQENHVTRVKLRPCKFRPAFFGAISKTRIFYKYVVFKHFLFSPNFHCSAGTLFSMTFFLFTNRSEKQKMDKPCRHSFLQYTLTNRLFSLSLLVQNVLAAVSSVSFIYLGIEMIQPGKSFS